jgi:E3 ubiquitin-protein ligase TRIP12
MVEAAPSTQTSARRQKKRPSKKEPDSNIKDTEEETPKPIKKERESPAGLDHSDSNDAESPRDLDDDMADPFGAGLFGGRGPPFGMSNTLRALSGMMSGMSSRLRDLLNNLRQKDDPTIQLVALEELSNLLLVSNEDNLSGQFSPDPYVKELISLMQPNEITGEENPETMLLACRCIANLMEALRGSVANVVYGGAVPVLCQKLLEIHYIDVAEQALSVSIPNSMSSVNVADLRIQTLSKISIDFPGSIVREGGLTACLQFLDFFATGTQRTAVTTAANCCRNIPHDSFPVIRDVMPILQNVLVSPDQKVVEQGCLCVTRIIDSFKHNHEKLEELVDAPLLKLVLGLLLPGTTNLIGVNIHTEFLRVLAIVARASPRLSMELLKMNVVDTLYQILTGVSPPDDTANAASKIDSVVIMQALIHRPREQVYETLNVICELLPRPKGQSLFSFDDYNDFVGDIVDESPRTRSKDSVVDKRLKLLEDCKADTRRFAMVLLPTLTDAYSSTVNLSVRQKVLTAQLKILSNLDTEVVEEALRPVPYASFLASILSQEDHPSLVLLALQASELLLERLEHIYQYQFYREGVIAEIKKLASRPLAAKKDSSFSKHSRSTDSLKAKRTYANLSDVENAEAQSAGLGEDFEQRVNNEDDDEQDDGVDHIDDDDDDDGDGDGDIVIREDGDGMSDSHSSDSSDEESLSDIAASGVKDIIILRADKFIELYETSKGHELRDRAGQILTELQTLAKDIEICYLGDGYGDGRQLFSRLARFFHGDALESITSSELLSSEIIRVFLDVFKDASSTGQSRADFLEAFMGTAFPNNINSSTGKGETTAFSLLIQKLQDLLSRAEHFEVLTVNNSASENSRGSSTSMLSKQLRLKLTADADSDIPQSYRDITVSIHAIATFKALDDYLRPRISLSERPHSGHRRRDMLATLANARMRELSGASESGLFGTTSGLAGSVPSAPSSGAKAKAPRHPSQSMPSSAGKAESSSAAKESRQAPRRSSRRHQPGVSSSNSPQTAFAPEPKSESVRPTLECADEKQISDDEVDADDTGALEAIVDDLDDGTSNDEAPEPSAVNMEIASTGKVTARKEDGTRVATPLQPGTPVSAGTRPNPTSHAASIHSSRGGSLALSARQFSYAAALAAVPQDWHIEFSMDDKKIPKDTTIYRAVYHNRKQPQDPPARNVWSGIHGIKFKRVKGPPTEPTKIKSVMDAPENEEIGRMPASLGGHPTTSSILSLLGILHEMNSNIDDVLDGRQPSHTLIPEPLAQFINTKLTAKMNRQLEEPLIVASNCLPTWSEDLARLFPFLFPFETRHLFLQSTSFGYSRSMMRWQSAQSESDDRRDRRRDERPLMGRLQRQKVRISRTRILESALKVMEMYGGSPSVLEVEYFEEVGTGLGPTLEFYSTVSKEFSKKKLKMWRENESNDHDEYAFGKLGVFPAPMSQERLGSEAGKKLLHLFKMLGNFVARSMLDSRIIDISFNPTLFRLANGSNVPPSVALVKTVDHDLANSLTQVKQFVTVKAQIEEDPHMSPAQKTHALQDICVHGAHVEDLMLDFTLPGYPSIELIQTGSSTPVTIDNVGLYIDRVLDMTIGAGVMKQIEAFKSGFSQVFSYSSLRAFTPDELIMLFGRVEEDWSLETLMDSIKADHGFNMDSKSVKNLLQTMSELSPTQRRDFLQFVTGSPKLPIGGK